MLLFFDLDNRASHGITLNRVRGRHERIDSYVGITKQGEYEMGLTMEDAKRIEAQFMPPRKKQDDDLN